MIMMISTRWLAHLIDRSINVFAQFVRILTSCAERPAVLMDLLYYYTCSTGRVLSIRPGSQAKGEGKEGAGLSANLMLQLFYVSGPGPIHIHIFIVQCVVLQCNLCLTTLNWLYTFVLCVNYDRDKFCKFLILLTWSTRLSWHIIKTQTHHKNPIAGIFPVSRDNLANIMW